MDSFINLPCKREQASSNKKTEKSKQKKYHISSLPTEDAAGFEVGEHVLIHKKKQQEMEGN